MYLLGDECESAGECANALRVSVRVPVSVCVCVCDAVSGCAHEYMGRDGTKTGSKYCSSQGPSRKQMAHANWVI